MRLRLATCVVLIACGSSSPRPAEVPDQPTRAPTPATLYQRLGGREAITAVVHDFVTRTTSDPRIKDRFFNTDPVHLENMLVELVCMASGGPCTYSGREMGATHAGMDLVGDEFDALVSDLQATLEKLHVPAREQGELLGALGPMRPQIVVAADHLHPMDAKTLEQVTAFLGTLNDPAAKDLLAMAVVAGRRGQRSYAEQLFTRAEMLTGSDVVAKVAGAFRDGAPPVVTTPLTKLADTSPQPAALGSSETDEPVTKPQRGSLTGSLRIDGKGPDALGVVMLWPEHGATKRTPKQRVIEQRGKLFEPHVMAVPVGSTVAFPNYDSVFHNVFSLSKSKAFDLGMYKNGQSREITFDKPGIIRLGCNLHANMSAFLIVVDAPHYAVVGPDGAFSFKSLAPGTYKVQAWTERSGEPVTSQITIAAGANAKDLDLTAAAPVAPPDKFGAPR